MGLTMEEGTERTNYIRSNIQVTTSKDEKPYVFISYKSDDWRDVFQKVIFRLQSDYGLRVYCDSDFEANNDSWIELMKENILSPYCMAVIAFFSNDYISSYATLLEIITSQTDEIAASALDMNPKPIIPVFLNGASSFFEYRKKNIKRLSNKCGIKKVEWDAIQKCMSDKFSKAKLRDKLDSLDRIGKEADLKVSDVVSTFIDLESSIAKNVNIFVDNPAFYQNLNDTIRSVQGKIESYEEEMGSVFDDTLKGGFKKAVLLDVESVGQNAESTAKEEKRNIESDSVSQEHIMSLEHEIVQGNALTDKNQYPSTKGTGGRVKVSFSFSGEEYKQYVAMRGAEKDFERVSRDAVGLRGIYQFMLWFMVNRGVEVGTHVYGIDKNDVDKNGRNRGLRKWKDVLCVDSLSDSAKQLIHAENNSKYAVDEDGDLCVYVGGNLDSDIRSMTKMFAELAGKEDISGYTLYFGGNPELS